MTDLSATERSLRRSSALMLIGLILLAGVVVRALAFTPLEAAQGAAQKIVYLHASSGWVAFLAFGVVGVCSVMYLLMRDMRLDRLAASSAEVGVVFTSGVLISGPLWGKPIWGTWWTWDWRLTSTLLLWFIFFGYFVLRAAVQEPGQRARFSAVLGVLGAALVPFIHMSVYLFRTMHPRPIVLRPDGPQMPPEMLLTLFSSFVVLTLFYAALTWHRYVLASRDEAIAAARAEADHA